MLSFQDSAQSHILQNNQEEYKSAFMDAMKEIRETVHKLQNMPPPTPPQNISQQTLSLTQLPPWQLTINPAEQLTTLSQQTSEKRKRKTPNQQNL